MKNIMKNLAPVFLMTAIIVILSGGAAATYADDPVFTLNETEVIFSGTNKMIQLEAITETEAKPEAEWVSSDTSVAALENNGVWSYANKNQYGFVADLLGLKKGMAVVSLRDKNTGTVYASCRVTVEDNIPYHELYVGGVLVTEENAMKALRDKGTTCVIVAHRLSTIVDCDRIYVMDHGRIVQGGTHAQLYQEDGLYRKLVG